MRYLTIDAVLELYHRVMEQSGGATGIRDPNALASASAQPRMTFGGQELCPTIVEKVSAQGFSLIQNHPFVDGNKRIGHAAMERMLESDQPYVLDVLVPYTEHVLPFIPSGRTVHDMIIE